MIPSLASWTAFVIPAARNPDFIRERPLSPLIQGGVEILIMVNVEWDNADGIRTLKEKVESVNFPVGEDEEYKDDSNEILKSIGVEEEEESDSDSNL